MDVSRRDRGADTNPENDILSQSRSVARPLAIGLIGVLLLIAGGMVWLFLGRAPQTVSGQGYLVPKGGYGAIFASSDGDIEWIGGRPGDVLKPDSIVALIRKPNGETVKQRAGTVGRISTILVQPGEGVSGVAPLMSIARLDEPLVVLALLRSEDAEKVAKGMKALVSLPNFPSAQSGSIEGRVEESRAIPLTRQRLLVLLAGNSSLTDQILENGPVSEVYIALTRNGKNPSGYEWTVGHGPSASLDLGTITDVEIELEDQKIVSAIAE